MGLVVDTSVIISVITNEKHKQQLIKITRGEELIAPESLHWEIGNAFSAMFKRKRIDINRTRRALGPFRDKAGNPGNRNHRPGGFRKDSSGIRGGDHKP